MLIQQKGTQFKPETKVLHFTLAQTTYNMELVNA